MRANNLRSLIVMDTRRTTESRHLIENGLCETLAEPIRKRPLIRGLFACPRIYRKAARDTQAAFPISKTR